MDIATLARLYGYPAVVLGTMLQGEAVLLVCGFLAHQGYLSVWGVWITAIISAMTGDVTYFYLGRVWGDRFIAKLPRFLRSGVSRAGNMVSRHPRQVMLFMRFMFGMRIIMPILCGVSSIPRGRFLRYNFLTALIWATIFTGAGWLFGVAAKPFISEVEDIELVIILSLAAAGILYNYVGQKVRSRWNRNNQSPSP